MDRLRLSELFRAVPCIGPLADHVRIEVGDEWDGESAVLAASEAEQLHEWLGEWLNKWRARA